MYNKKKATDKPVGKSSGLNHSSSTRTFSKKSDSKKTISQQGKTHKPAAVKIESDAKASYRKISTAFLKTQMSVLSTKSAAAASTRVWLTKNSYL